MGLEVPKSVYRPYFANGIPIGVQAVDADPTVGRVHFSDGMFLPFDANLTAIMTYSLHYGGGAFEGIRSRLDPVNGPYLLNVAANMARLIIGQWHVMIDKDPILADLMTKGAIILDQRTPSELFTGAQAAFDNGEEFGIRYKVGNTVNTKPFSLGANQNFQQFDYRIRHLIAVIQALLFLDNTAFAQYPVYIRPFIFVNALLKIPTAGKMTSISMATRPWGNYLNDKDYATGLTVLEAPYPRIGDDMPYDAKASGNYENSRLNVNAVAIVNALLGEALGYEFGEVIVKNRTGEYVEGSAENLAAFVQHGSEMRAITPPTGKETGILAGTTRHRFIEWCEQNKIKVEYRGITQSDLTHAKALVMMGTGAGIIHVKSIVRFPGLRRIMDAYKGLRSEIALSDPVQVGPLLQTPPETTLINGGVKDPIVDRVQNELLNVGSKLPLWRIDFHSLSEALELPLEEIVPVELRAGIRERTRLTAEDKRELRIKMHEAQKICRKAYELGRVKIPEVRMERLSKICSGWR